MPKQARLSSANSSNLSKKVIEAASGGPHLARIERYKKEKVKMASVVKAMLQ